MDLIVLMISLILSDRHFWNLSLGNTDLSPGLLSLDETKRWSFNLFAGSYGVSTCQFRQPSPYMGKTFKFNNFESDKLNQNSLC